MKYCKNGQRIKLISVDATDERKGLCIGSIGTCLEDSEIPYVKFNKGPSHWAVLARQCHPLDAKEARPTVRAKRPAQQPQHEICVWHHDDEAWSTDCGQYFVLNSGRPYQNGMRFCYHCGRRLHAVR